MRIITLITIFLFPLLVSAYPGEYPWDPLYVETQPTLETQNNQTIQRLKSQYGISAYYDCYGKCTSNDLGNPSNMQRCLMKVEYCLESMAVQEEVKSGQNEQPSGEQSCKNSYGPYSTLDRYDSSTNTNYCGCVSGYVFNESETQCIEEKSCGPNYILRNGVCECPSAIGYQEINGECVLFDEHCKKLLGQHSHGKKEGLLGWKCDCNEGYRYNSSGTACIEDVVVKGYSSPSIEDELTAPSASVGSGGSNSAKEFINEEKGLVKQIDDRLSNRLRGTILLQTERNGEAWYVNPDDGNKYFLGRPEDAFTVMRELGLGATHEFIATHEYFPSHVLGKILIDVEQSGEAYYINPKDKKSYYLGRPSDAFQIMREMGLGISNSDLRKIEVGTLSQ